MGYMHANSNCLHVKSLKNDREGFVFGVSFLLNHYSLQKSIIRPPTLEMLPTKVDIVLKYTITTP